MNKATLRFFALVALLALGVFCKINFSDGDDAIFDDMVRSMPYLEYIKMRYLTWTGRIGGETLAYLTFSLGIWFWRFANAAMVATVPMLVLLIVKQLRPAEGIAEKESLWQALRLPLLICAGYLLMDIVTCGHAAVWVNGSIFYTWSFALVLLCIYLNLRFLRSGTVSARQGALLLPVLFFAAASIEQIGVILATFFAGILIYRKRQKKTLPAGILVEIAFLITTLAVATAAPGNMERISQETSSWFPGFAELSLSERAFISTQWFLSSLANEGKLFLVFIWIGSLLVAPTKGKVDITLSAIFTAIALLPFAGVHAHSDLGIDYINPAIPPTVFPSFANATPMNLIAMAWWLGATAFTFYMVNKSMKLGGVAALAAALLCEAMMFFTPTIYASGERVFFVTDWVLTAMIATLFLRIPSEKGKNAFFASLCCMALFNLATQIPELLAKLHG